MAAHACRTRFGNYITACAAQADCWMHTHAHTHLVIITWLHQFHWFMGQAALARRQRNDHTVFELLPAATYVNRTKAKSSHCLFSAELQAGKLWIPIFKACWYGSTRELNPGLPIARRTLLPLPITAQSSVTKPASRNAQISINKNMIVLSSKHLPY